MSHLLLCIFCAVEYAKGEEPHLLKSGKYNLEPNSKTCVAISPDGNVIAIGSGTGLTVINALEELIDMTIPNMYTGKKSLATVKIQMRN